MANEALQEKLRWVTAQLRKAQEEQKAKEKELSEKDSAMKKAGQKFGEVSSEMGGLASDVISRLAQFSGLKFHDLYQAGFHDHYTARTNAWMGQTSGAMSTIKTAVEKAAMEEKEKETLAKKLLRQAEEIKREIERSVDGL